MRYKYPNSLDESQSIYFWPFKSLYGDKRSILFLKNTYLSGLFEFKTHQCVIIR